MTETATPPNAQPNPAEAGSPAKPDSLLGEASKQTPPAAETTPPPAPDAGKTPEPKYDFKAPEGTEFDPAVIKSYAEVAKEVALSPESAQKVLDKIAPVLQARFAEQAQVAAAAAQDEQERTWRKEAAADKEFGGDNLKPNVALAIAGAQNLGGKELLDLLDKTRLGSNLTVLRALAKHGKAISQDKFVQAGGGGGQSTRPTRLEDVLYKK